MTWSNPPLIFFVGLLASSAYAQTSSQASTSQASTSHRSLADISLDVNNGPTSGRGVNFGLEVRPIADLQVSISTGGVIIDSHGALLNLHIGIRRWAVGASGNFMSLGQQMDPLMSNDNVTIDALGSYNVEVTSNSAVHNLVIGGPNSFPNLIVKEGVLLTIHGRLSLVSGSLQIAPGAHVVVFGSEAIVNGSESFNIFIGEGGSLKTPSLNVIDVSSNDDFAGDNEERRRSTIKPKLSIQGDGSIGFGASIINLVGATVHIDVPITIEAGTRFETDRKSKLVLGSAVNIRGAVTLAANLQIKSTVIFNSPSSSLRVASAHFLSGSTLMISALGNTTSTMVVDGLLEIDEGAALGLTFINEVAKNITIATYDQLIGSFGVGTLSGLSISAGLKTMVAIRV